MPVVVHDKFCWRQSSPSCLYAEVTDVPVEWPCRSSVAAVEVTAEIPQLQLVVLVLGQGRSHCRCVQRHFVWWFRVQSIATVAQLQCSDEEWDFFGALYTQVQGRESCPQGHGPKN